MEQQSDECPAEALDSEDLLFMLYTSGSTGKPKGLVHTQAGYLLYTGMTHQVSTPMSYPTHSIIIQSTNISQISSMAKIHNFIFTKLTRLLLEVPTRH